MGEEVPGQDSGLVERRGTVERWGSAERGAGGAKERRADRLPTSRSRLERRTYRRGVRRRRARRRLWLSTAPVLLLVVAVAVFLALAGRPESESLVPSTLPPWTANDELLLLEQGETVVAAVLLHAMDESGVVLVMPGTALLYLPDQGFRTIAEAHLAGWDDLLGASLGEALSVKVASVVVVPWTDLQARAGASGSGLLSTLSQELTREDLVRVAEVVSAVFAHESWTRACLEGRRVETGSGHYFEPDMSATRSLLVGTLDPQRAPDSGKAIVRIRNGSGALEVAEQTGLLLHSLGYRVAPPTNAEGFPNIELSSIRTAPDALSVGVGISRLLGVLNLAADDSLASGEVVLVLGKDFVPPTVLSQVVK